MYFRYIIVNIFSFIKRFFSFNATIYNAIVFIPLFTVLTPRISKRSLLFVSLFSFILLLTGNIRAYGQFVMYFLLLLAIPMFRRTDFDKLVNRTFLFFVLVCLYGVSQKLFGYSAVEINWIRSGLSFAEERAFIASDDIRPFSTFASMPEFTLFVSIYVYYFMCKKKYVLLAFALVMLYISGSRGVLISALVAFFFTFIVKRHTPGYLFLSFLTSLIIFFCLIIVFPILFDSGGNSVRMLAYGTFNGRIELLRSVIDQISPWTLLTGIDFTGLDISNGFDNFYFLIIANFGIFGAIYFLYFFVRQKITKKNFYFFSIFLGYGFYADMIFSYYLMFLFFVAIYSYSEISGDRSPETFVDNICFRQQLVYGAA